MAVRSVLVLLATAGLVTSVSAVAVGLGEIRLQSTINQPLAAEIELLSVEGREPSQLRAQLGSAEDFARAGLERPFALTGLAFRPVLDGAGGPVLKVTSSQLIREPFLDFLVRLEWPDGQLLRAYTVLLDLPEQGVQPPLARRSGPATFDNNAPPQRSSGVSPLRRPTIAPGSSSYTVRSGDTLWSVASRARPQGATVQQTLMAIYRQNPEAFIDGDMNRMRRDYALRVPESSEVAAIDADDARATVWREAGEGLSTAMVPASTSDIPAADPTGADSETPSGQLRLAAPQLDAPSAGAGMESAGSTASADTSDSAAAASTRASLDSGFSGDISESSSEAQGQDGAMAAASASEKILYLEEEVLLTRRENRELHERIDNLEEQLGVMSRLVELQSDTVAAGPLPEPSQPAEMTEADSGVFGKAWLALGGLAVLMLGGMVVRKRRHQQRDEPAAPGLFMIHDEGEAATQEQAFGDWEDLVEPNDEVEGDASGWAADAPESTEIDDDTAVSEPDSFAAFASGQESPEQSSDQSPDPLPEETFGAAAWGEEEDVEHSSDNAVDGDLSELEFDLDLELSDFDLASLEESVDPLSPESPEKTESTSATEADPETVNAEEVAASDEMSLEEWFAELAEESPSGQNSGADVAELADNASPANGATIVASNSDYRVATTFDLDFATFSGEDDALAQRDPLQTRLELARVYIDMQDSQSAKEILEELVMATNQDVQRDARELLHSLE